MPYIYINDAGQENERRRDMVPIFIASTRGYSGKTFVALGLGMKLKELGYKVGYMKPVGKSPIKRGGRVYDADAVFIREILSLTEPLDVISPVVLSYETQNLVYKGKIKENLKEILKSVRSMKDKDFLIIGGGADLSEGALLKSDALSIVEKTKSHAVVVESWAGDNSADSLFVCARLFGDRFMGAVINKVPSSSFSYVRNTVRPFLEKKGLKILGIFERDSLLESFTVRQLSEVLHGHILCCEEGLDEFVEHFSIGAMDVDSAINYFRRTPNKAVITGAHRSDIQLAAMETSTKCIILTGGLYANSVVIGKAQSKGIPIISVTEDTFTTVDRIESVMGKARILDSAKLARVKELFDREFDMKRFLKAAKTARCFA